MNKPVLAITMGDPASIGPEIVVKSAADKRLYQLCKPLIVGDAKTLEEAIRFCNAKIKINRVSTVRDAQFIPGTIDVLDLKNVDLLKLELGKVSAMCGEAAFQT